jgi:hypothetical protein
MDKNYFLKPVAGTEKKFLLTVIKAAVCSSLKQSHNLQKQSDSLLVTFQ